MADAAPDEELRALRDRLQRLEDLDEIRRLYIDYGRYLDAGDAINYAGLFARDGKLRLGPVMRADGRPAIERAVTELLKSTGGAARKSVHVLGSPRIELAGDTAFGECVWAAVSMSPAGASNVLVGRHVDELVREEGRWRFGRRAGHIDVGSLP